MSANESQTISSQESSRTDEPTIDLWPWQYQALFDCDQYPALHLCGGRGSGKSYIDAPRVLRWADLTTELYYGIFAPTESQLQTVLAPIRKALAYLEIGESFEKDPPREWQEQWDADGILYPSPRLRKDKVWIWENGMHIFCATVLNNAYTRAKSLDFNAILFQEATEPGVHNNVFTTLVGCLRCGAATKQRDGSWRCVVPGHIHQLVTAYNVPLRDPSHFIRKKVRRLLDQEATRKDAGKKPYFFLIQSRTQDNRATGDDYLDNLAAEMDADTFIEQTSGDLFTVSANQLTYRAFTNDNILPRRDWLKPLVYDPKRPLHIWFDFNTTPACAGWGHDLLPHEVPDIERKGGHEYFGVIGELFSDNDPMHTDQVAEALLEDPREYVPPSDQRCNDCGRKSCPSFVRDHLPLGDGVFHCTVCGASCAGHAITYPTSKKYIHATPNWRGLKSHRGKIFVYGDASGKSEHAAAVKGPCLQILRNAFEVLGDHVEFRFKEGNPPIVLRELAVNRSLCTAGGIRTLFFAPHVTAHLADCREVVPGPDGTALKKQWSEAARKKGDEYPKRTHCLDGLGYKIDYTNPAHIPKAGGMPATADGPDFGPLATDWPEP